MPIVVLIRIFGGIVTVTEATALAAVAALLVSLIFSRGVRVSQTVSVIADALRSAGTFMLIVAGALAFGHWMTETGAPAALVNWVLAHNLPTWTFLLTMNMPLLILGCFLGVVAALLLVIPVLIVGLPPLPERRRTFMFVAAPARGDAMRAADTQDITAPEADGPDGRSPLFAPKDLAAPSVFRPENLLREARRQKSIAAGSVPPVCVLDPDGDIVRAVRADGRARRNAAWACYHTDMDEIVHDGETLGIVGCAVGAPFAVLVAEQMFASGCTLLISVTSSGRIGDAAPDASFVLIDRALRDEGTSLHYCPPSRFANADPALIGRIEAGLAAHRPRVWRGATWTTDAPFRETEAAIAAAASAGVLAVEMEAAALYAFAAARGRAVVCFAHVTNQMARIDGDFEKGEANGARDALALIGATIKAWRRSA